MVPHHTMKLTDEYVILMKWEDGDETRNEIKIK